MIVGFGGGGIFVWYYQENNFLFMEPYYVLHMECITRIHEDDKLTNSHVDRLSQN